MRENSPTLLGPGHLQLPQLIFFTGDNFSLQIIFFLKFRCLTITFILNISRQNNQKIYFVREHLLLVLLKKKVISMELMTRIYDLAKVFEELKGPDGKIQKPFWPLMGSLEDLMQKPGVSEMLNLKRKFHDTDI